MRSELLLLTLLCAAPALADEPAPDPRPSAALTLAAPVEVAFIGLSAGLKPELLYRPLDPDGVFNLRAAVGLMPGPSLTFLPVELGARWHWRPWRWFQPQLGLGYQHQTFVHRGGVDTRSSVYLELGAAARVWRQLEAQLMVAPDFALPFGPGFAVRAGVGWRFGG